ncbi:MAG: deoxyhypusine synthase family protein [Candidatus Paceibacterota bacterium]|jgi:deoxyhypusine synthase
MINKFFRKKVENIEVKERKLAELVDLMAETGFQGKKLGEVAKIWLKMIEDPEVTIIMGFAGSMSTTGQSNIINWLIENRYIDILVSTGANIAEDIILGMGYSYWQGSATANDMDLLKNNINRYYDVYGEDAEYSEMIKLIAEFYKECDSSKNFSSRSLLKDFGDWLNKKDIKCIVSTAAKNGVPIFCPAIVDSPYGDAALLAQREGKKIVIDQVLDFTEWIKMGEDFKKSGVIYIGGGVPKDFIQISAVSSALLYEENKQGKRGGAQYREQSGEYFYPHNYAIQITTDSPQWGGLSGCTFEEASSWGKETVDGDNAICYCDATIALPLVSHYLKDKASKRKNAPEFPF